MENILSKIGKNIRVKFSDMDLVLATNSYVFIEHLFDLNSELELGVDHMSQLINELTAQQDWFIENNLMLLVTDRNDAFVIFDPEKKKTVSGQLIFLCREDKASRMIGTDGDYLNTFLNQINKWYKTDYKFIQMIKIQNENENEYKTVDTYRKRGDK